MTGISFLRIFFNPRRFENPRGSHLILTRKKTSTQDASHLKIVFLSNLFTEMDRFRQKQKQKEYHGTRNLPDKLRRQWRKEDCNQLGYHFRLEPQRQTDDHTGTLRSHPCHSLKRSNSFKLSSVIWFLLHAILERAVYIRLEQYNKAFKNWKQFAFVTTFSSTNWLSELLTKKNF